MDFDAYHPRLIADIIDYNLPDGSVHEYFGKQYFGKSNLSEEEYEQSKKITFRFLQKFHFLKKQDHLLEAYGVTLKKMDL